MIDNMKILNYESSINNLVQGFTESNGGFTCLVCGHQFENGIVYNMRGTLYEARKAVSEHVMAEHGDMFTVLLNLGKEANGLSEIQQTILAMLYNGWNDRHIAKELGDKSASTIRNHRFQLRRKAKEARVFLALMELLELRLGTEQQFNQQFLEFHRDIPVDDERIMITAGEAEKIRRKHFSSRKPLRLVSFPKKEKSKLVILLDIAKHFEKNRSYTEKEVNDILLPVFEDYVTIRRYLVDYRFLKRKPGGRDYTLNF